MAITIKDSPAAYNPAYNSITYIVDSTKKNECRFRYMADVYVNGDYVTTLKASPIGDYNYGLFDVSRIVQNYVSYKFSNNLFGFEPYTECYCTLQLKFGEEYDDSLDCSEEVVEYPELTNSSTVYCWNAAIQYDKFPGFNHNTYLANDANAKFLTASPETINVKDYERFVFSFIQDTGTPVTKMVINTFSSSNTLLGTYEIDNSLSSAIFLNVGVGPSNLNASTLDSGTQPVISDNVSYYTVRLFNNSDPVSELKTFNIDRKDWKYTPKRLAWLNTLGGIDCFTFSIRSVDRVDISRTNFTKKPGSINVNSPNVSYGYSLGERGNTVLNVDAQEVNIFNSEWIKEETATWLQELFTSPEVQIIKQPDNVNITAIYCSSSDFDITSVQFNSGTVNFSIDDNGEVLPIGTEFSYIVDDGSPIGMSNFGSGTITAYLGSGVYSTTVPASISASASVTGTFTIVPHTFIVTDSELNVGDIVLIDACAECLSIENKKIAKVISDAGGNTYMLDLECTGNSSCIPYKGIVTPLNYSASMIPIVINSTSYEFKTKKNQKNINYSIEVQPAYKRNIQRN